MAITITGGSEKQNEWATRIAVREMSIFDEELAAVARRNAEGDQLEAYEAALNANRATLVAGFAKIKAQELIELDRAKRANFAAMLIKRARAA